MHRNRGTWSQEVSARSDALDLEPDVFTKASAKDIAESLKRSAESSRRRKAGAFRSAMSMLTFYINRAGRSLPEPRKSTLEAAKGQLRRLFGRPQNRPLPSGPRGLRPGPAKRAAGREM
jgi:hypothetical protein